MALYNDWNKHEILIGRRQISWLFAKRSRGVELRAIENKSSEWQGGGLGPRTTRLQVHHPNHSATPPPQLFVALVLFCLFFFANSLMGLAANYSLFNFFSLLDVITWISSVKTRTDSAQWRAQFSAASDFKVSRITSIHSAARSGLFGSTTTGHGISAAYSTSTWNSSRACIHQYVPSCL